MRKVAADLGLLVLVSTAVFLKQYFKYLIISSSNSLIDQDMNWPNSGYDNIYLVTKGTTDKMKL